VHHKSSNGHKKTQTNYTILKEKKRKKKKRKKKKRKKKEKIIKRSIDDVKAKAFSSILLTFFKQTDKNRR